MSKQQRYKKASPKRLLESAETEEEERSLVLDWRLLVSR
jgi:hypothetical protein